MNHDWMNVSNDENYNTSIVNLFNGVFNKKVSEEYLDWKNKKNPLGESLVQLAVKNQEVIGHLCVMKYKISFFGESIYAGQTADAMVNPNYRRMGIYEGLAKSAFEIAQRQGMSFIFRFPNQMALSASVSKQNTQKICDVPQYLKIINPYEATALFTKNKIIRFAGAMGFKALTLFNGLSKIEAKNYLVKEVESFTEEYDALWDEIKDEYKIAIERKMQYLNWRYIDNPNKYFIRSIYENEKLCGYVVAGIEIKKAKNGDTVEMCHVIDILCKSSSKKVLGILLKEVDLYAKRQGACAISCWMTNHLFYRTGLKNAGYFQFRSPSVLAGVIVSDTFKDKEDKIFNGDNWYITIGDSDYV